MLERLRSPLLTPVDMAWIGAGVLLIRLHLGLPSLPGNVLLGMLAVPASLPIQCSRSYGGSVEFAP